MASQELINLNLQLEKFISNGKLDEAIINNYCDICNVAFNTEKDIAFGLKMSARAKTLINSLVNSIFHNDKMNIFTFEKMAQERSEEYNLVSKYYELLKFESYYCLESFIYYMERKRQYQKRFYYPRRKTLNIVVGDLQELEDRKFKFYGLSMPSRVGKSTICLMFLSWIMLKRPNSHNAMGGHSGILAKGFYKELLNFVSTEEYTFEELYGYYHPNHILIRDKSADEYTITLDEPDRFATVTCRGIDGTWTGSVDVSADGYLYVDDLVRDREHSLSPYRMENTYQEYLNKMVDRKNDGARELMVGTLWNVLDPLERIRKEHSGNPEYRFRKIPALNENDESNFDYEINGFSTKFYHNMRDMIDNAEWMAKYMQQPYVREGLVFPVDELGYFNGILPPGDFRVVAVVDVAWGGGDSLSMPIGADHEDGYVYIFDWVFNKGAKEETLPLVVGQIINNKIRQIQFEGNTGGELYCTYVDEMLRNQGWKCSCTHKKAPNMMAKMSKIIAYSGDVKRKFKFLSKRTPTEEEIEKDKKNGVMRYRRSKEYQAAMDEFSTFVSIGKNNSDDAADGITQLAMFLECPRGNIATVEAVINPFRAGGHYL